MESASERGNKQKVYDKYYLPRTCPILHEDAGPKRTCFLNLFLSLLRPILRVDDVDDTPLTNSRQRARDGECVDD